jgi:phage terminase large subunit
MQEINLEVTPHFLPLFDPGNEHYNKRYLSWYGGRGGMKSWQIGRGLLIRGKREPKKILCTREHLNSISESVYAVLEGQARILGLTGFYDFKNSEIVGQNGTKFIFKGIKQNIGSIKSFEDVDIVWNEEAEGTSQKSIDTLYPTIRKPGSQIITSFNPKNSTDPIYIETVINHDPSEAYLCKVSYLDNPWIDQEFIKRAEKIKATDLELYEHIYLGGLDNRNSGTVYGKQMSRARDERRITSVPYDPSCEVFTAWDLGFADATAIWWLQFVGRELRWIDYYENCGEQLDHYAKVIKSKPYNYLKNGHFLPHDGGAGNIRGDSVSAQLNSLGIQNQVLEREQDITPGIELLRQTIAFSVFDKEKCSQGIRALEHYHFLYDEERQRFKDKPNHDWSSNGADSGRYASRAAGIIKSNIGLTGPLPVLNFSRSYMGI